MAELTTAKTFNRSEISRGLEKIYHIPPKPLDVCRILVLSDVHLLHRRVPTWHIIEVLKEKIISGGETLDAIYIAGDLFDDSRYLRQDESQEAVGFLTWLLEWCRSTKTALRIIEGTPSHDHGQSKVVEALNITVGVDCLYLAGIGVFYDEAIKATVGWVQDEYKDRVAVNTEAEMAELTATRGLEKVDFFFMHGCFKFQVPIESPHWFDEDFWISRCRLGIYIGHDHREKVFSLIRVMGSVDRLAHGENEDKGMTLVDFTPTVARNYFLVNQAACPMRAVEANEDYTAQLAECLDALAYIDEHPSRAIGRFKVEYHNGSPIADHVSKWKREYGFHIEGKRVNTKDEEQRLVAVFSTEAVVDERITPDNVERILLEGMNGMKYDPAIVSDIVRSIQ